MKTQDDHRRESMEMWKEEYDQIPVPQETRDRIEAGIMRARLEKKRSDRMKNMKRTGVTAARHPRYWQHCKSGDHPQLQRKYKQRHDG